MIICSDNESHPIISASTFLEIQCIFEKRLFSLQFKTSDCGSCTPSLGKLF